jgi:hypothetical protein
LETWSPVTLAINRGTKSLGKGSFEARRHMMGEQGDAGQLRKVEERYDGYDVYDVNHDKIGSVDATYVNESNQREYIVVSGGLSSVIPGSSGSYLIPVDLCTIDNNQRNIEASTTEDAVKNSPSLSSNTDLTPEYEQEVRKYYRL